MTRQARQEERPDKHFARITSKANAFCSENGYAAPFQLRNIAHLKYFNHEKI
jgi:hypothetical protein